MHILQGEQPLNNSFRSNDKETRAGFIFIGFLACIAWAEESHGRSLEESLAIEAVPPTLTAAFKVGTDP